MSEVDVVRISWIVSVCSIKLSSRMLMFIASTLKALDNTMVTGVPMKSTSASNKIM